jgi:hypothetical protein
MKFREPNTPILYISSVMGMGIEDVKYKMWELVKANN